MQKARHHRPDRSDASSPRNLGEKVTVREGNCRSLNDQDWQITSLRIWGPGPGGGGKREGEADRRLTRLRAARSHPSSSMERMVLKISSARTLSSNGANGSDMPEPVRRS